MKIWTVITDDCNGTTTQVFANAEAADTAAHAWCKEDWPFETPCPEDWREAYKALGDGDDFLWVEEHNLPDAELLIALQRSARAQLDDLLAQVHQMMGMFDDADGAIARAVADAEAWPNEIQTDTQEACDA